MNSACAYHVKRKAVISKLGLDEDDALPSPLSKAVTLSMDLIDNDHDDTVERTRQETSDAIVVQDQAATSGETPDASDADPGPDNEDSESGPQHGDSGSSGDSSKAAPQEDPLDAIRFFGEQTAGPKPKAKGTGRGKKTKPEEGVSEPPQKRRKLKKTQESLTDLNQLQELAVTFA